MPKSTLSIIFIAIAALSLLVQPVAASPTLPMAMATAVAGQGPAQDAAKIAR